MTDLGCKGWVGAGIFFNTTYLQYLDQKNGRGNVLAFGCKQRKMTDLDGAAKALAN